MKNLLRLSALAVALLAFIAVQDGGAGVQAGDQEIYSHGGGGTSPEVAPHGGDDGFLSHGGDGDTPHGGGLGAPHHGGGSIC